MSRVSLNLRSHAMPTDTCVGESQWSRCGCHCHAAAGRTSPTFLKFACFAPRSPIPCWPAQRRRLRAFRPSIGALWALQCVQGPALARMRVLPLETRELNYIREIKGILLQHRESLEKRVWALSVAERPRRLEFLVIEYCPCCACARMRRKQKAQPPSDLQQQLRCFGLVLGVSVS